MARIRQARNGGSSLKRGPMDPQLIQAWNKGRDAGRNDAIEIFQKYLAERMDTLQKIHGVGPVMALRIFEHFQEGMEE